MKPLFAVLYGLIGAAMVYYGIYPVRRGIMMGFILIALGAFFILCIPGSFIVKARWPMLYRALRVVFASVLSLGAVLLAIACGQIYSRYNPENAPQNSVVVVLGAGLSRLDYTTPSLTLSQRLDEAARVLEQRPNALCIVTGGQGERELITEALSMKTYLVERKGIDPARIIMEERARDTEENLLFTAQLLRERGLFDACGGNAAIVTSGFHEFRACHFAIAAGLTPHSLPAPLLHGLAPMYWMREALAVVMEVWLGVYA